MGNSRNNNPGKNSQIDFNNWDRNLITAAMILFIGEFKELVMALLIGRQIQSKLVSVVVLHYKFINNI